MQEKSPVVLKDSLTPWDTIITDVERMVAEHENWIVQLNSSLTLLKELRDQGARELNALFELQHTRMTEAAALWLTEATALWREATGQHDILPDLGSLLEWLMAQAEELRQGIRDHRNQKADDRCVEDDDKLYALLRDGVKCDRRVGSKAEMLANCERFIDRRCEGGG